jgi:hypothetical protein
MEFIRMDMSRRLIGVSAVRSHDYEVCDVDIEDLIHRLLLFDKYVLVSQRLEEFPHLVRYFGFEGLKELLAAKLIEIRCECFQPAQTAQTNFSGYPTYPPFTYRLDWIDAHDRRKYIHDCLQNVHRSQGLQLKQLKKLKLAIVDAILPPPTEERKEWGPSSQFEILNNVKLVRASIDLVLRTRLGLENVPYSFSVSRGDSDTYQVSTDLSERLRIEDIEAHRFIERGLIGVAALTQALGEMKAYSAISGFREDEIPLFRYKLDFLAETASSQKREDNFRRVIDIAELPTLLAEAGRINVEKLLKIRDSSEAREFRDWLGGEVGDLTDREIRDRVCGFRATLGLKSGNTIGKAMRFLITTVVGLVPHAIVPAVALSFLDQFVLEKILPKSGISAFVNELYPSLFESKK